MNLLLFLCFVFIVFFLYRYKNNFPYTYIFSLFWFINLGISELFFAEYMFSTFLYVLIIFSIFFTFAGELLGSKRKSEKNTKKINYNSVRCKYIFWLIFFIAMCYPAINLINNGISIGRLFSLEQLLAVNNEMAVARYSGETESSLIGQFCLIFVYCLPFYSSLLVGFHHKKKYIYLSLLPGLLVTLTQNTKLVLISSLLAIIVGIIVQNIVINNKLIRMKFKTIFYTSIGFIIFYGLMVFSFVARIGKFDANSFGVANSKIASYVAHMPALDHWLRTFDFSNMIKSYGVKTFFGITNTLGIVERKSGIFTEFFVFKDSGQDFQTNIYTVYRFLIEDFGFTGTMFFFLIIAFIFSLLRYTNNVVMKFTVLSMLVFFIFNSYVSSIWAYFSYIVAYIVLYLAIKFVLDFKIKKL
ncbi:oligosaccharide repeat unit polymerase [Chryseobacterium sp. LC2016-29]|uniref:O-antigen polymerase n=1 Tax=Chryseobacterium sp. LC2016-29 TaxID=2897331 RepID=UPI001E37E893|nr:O-antigen polymerase [Chryseobacterium sp. LC2016-29]MCD0480329.1 oligosaccharide repeat unit polymerase [Chryseobacterium sp. LC2016-29]